MPSPPRNRVLLTAEIAAPPDEAFNFLTDRFLELWPGKNEIVTPAPAPNEPHGLGMIRRMKPTGSEALEEEIVTHDRPRVIEYKVINETRISNHLGRLELTPSGSGTHLDYTIAFDYRPRPLGPVAAIALKAIWKRAAVPKLKAAFPGE